jgi:hypothetical protein
VQRRFGRLEKYLIIPEATPKDIEGDTKPIRIYLSPSEKLRKPS